MQINSIVNTRKLVEDGQVSLTEIVDGYLRAIKNKNSDVNAVVALYEDESRQTADRIEKKIKEGKAGKLAGAVVGIKDVLTEKGKICSCASHILRNYESVYDATAVSRLKHEDAIIIGRMNMDEFAMGSSTENSIYGATRNPHDLSRVPGGSSGGSAAAVAAGFCNVSLGSDTGGSIRQPASYCGVVGLKPSYGRVSRYGLVAYASSFDSIGPITNSVEDAARMLHVIAGNDTLDMTSSNKLVPDYISAIENPDSKIKIGVPEEYFAEGLDPEIYKIITDQLSELERNGAELIPVSLPNTRNAIASYYILATAEASSNLARFDGIRYGHRVNETLLKQVVRAEKAHLVGDSGNSDSTLIALYKKSRTEGFGIEAKRRILLGTYVLSAGYYEAYYGKAQKIRRLIQQDFARVFNTVDVIVSPTAPTTAFKIGENQDDPLKMYLNDIYTISANLAGICGISVPAGIHSNGMPVGIQFMAAAFNEEMLFRVGRLVELHKT